MRWKRLVGRLEGNDLAIDARLAHAAGDQLGDLAAEIDDEDGVGCASGFHGGRLKKATFAMGAIGRARLTPQVGCAVDQDPSAAVGERRLQAVDRVGQLLVDDVQIFGPVAEWLSSAAPSEMPRSPISGMPKIWQARSTAKVSMSTMSAAIAS